MNIELGQQQEPNQETTIQNTDTAILNNQYKLYQAWGGSHKFLFGGSLMCGPSNNICTMYGSWSALIGVSIPYFIVIVSFLFERNETIILGVINIFFFLSTTISLSVTSFSDPGIIPNKQIWELEGQVPEQLRIPDLQLVESRNIQNTQNGDQNQQIHIPQMKYVLTEEAQKNYEINHFTNQIVNKNDGSVSCRTCQIMRPSRASHCRSCNVCVEVFDHHCIFVNNCIGKRNYQFFIGFILSVTLLCISYMIGLFVFLGYKLRSQVQQQDKADQEKTNALLLGLGIPIGLVVLFSFGLCIFHIYLQWRGMTTRERLKHIENISQKQKNNCCVMDSTLFDPKRKINGQEYQKLITFNQKSDRTFV